VRERSRYILKILRRIIEYLLRARIYGYPSSIMQIIPNKKRKNAWFSYLSIVRSIIEDYQIDLIIDVGANKGEFALELRNFYKGPLISFEPVPHIFELLRNNASNDKNWYTFNYGLGDESKQQYINIYEKSTFNSLLEMNKYCVEHFEVGKEKPKKQLIQIRRFDDIIDEIPLNIYSRNIFLKMDTQGYDLDVFRGTQKINKNLIALQSECSHIPVYDNMPNWIESLKEYERAGFKLIGLYPVNRDGYYYIESDCLMVKR
jgi:FkbM family methyltransferase